MPRSQGRAETEHASRYLAEICGHFADHVPAEWDERSGFADFGWGSCTLVATPGALLFHAQAPDEPGLARVEFVLDDHTERFGSPESLTVVWLPTDDAQSRPADDGIPDPA